MNPTTQDYVVIGAQILIFLALWAVLRRLWFEPVAAVLRERRVRSEGAVAEAAVVEAEAEKLRAEHAQALAATRTEAQHEVQEILRVAEAEQKRLVEAASADAERVLDEARRRIAAETAEARQSVGAEADAIARQVAVAIVGRAV
jgi:F-type H+-transporting ATPase subunit b